MDTTKVSNQELLVSTSNGSITTTADAKYGFKKTFLLPIFIFVAIPTVCIVTYVIAVFKGHVDPVLPYISETGSLPPESCIFSQVLNIVSFFMILTVYLKYLQVREFAKLFPSRAHRLRRNRIAAYFGAASSIGVSVVANFQESNVLIVHILGAGTVFLWGTVYFSMQTNLSRQMTPEINSLQTVYVRGVLSALSVFFNLTTIIPTIISLIQFKGDPMSGNARRHWGPDDGGYEAHLIGVISEWLLVLTFVLFIISCFKECTNLLVYSPQVVLLNVEPESSVEDNNINTISKMV